MNSGFVWRVVVMALVGFSFANLRGAESCDPIRTFADGRRAAREIFVSVSGDNGTGDGSRAMPYRTIAHAVQFARPGDAIRLLPGRYAGGAAVRNLAGTFEAPIWLGGVPGAARPHLTEASTALHLSRVRFLVIENLEISRATGNGINCDDGGDYGNPEATQHVLFRNLSFRDIGRGGNQDALKLSGVNDFAVLDCDFAGTSAGGSGIDHVGCHRGLIARCTFTDIGSNAIQCKGGSEDIEVRWNRFVNGGGRAINIGGSTGFTFFRPALSTNAVNFEARNIRVLANLFRGGDAPIAFVGAVDCLVAHNTIVEPRRWVLRILQETVSKDSFSFEPCGRNRFVNNLVSFDGIRIGTILNIGANTHPESFAFAHNLWHAFNDPSRSRPPLPVQEPGGVYGLDPLFADAARGDYSIRPDSPAAKRGVKLREVRADLKERCYGEPPSIGAFEPARGQGANR